MNPADKNPEKISVGLFQSFMLKVKYFLKIFEEVFIPWYSTWFVGFALPKLLAISSIFY